MSDLLKRLTLFGRQADHSGYRDGMFTSDRACQSLFRGFPFIPVLIICFSCLHMRPIVVTTLLTTSISWKVRWNVAAPNVHPSWITDTREHHQIPIHCLWHRTATLITNLETWILCRWHRIAIQTTRYKILCIPTLMTHTLWWFRQHLMACIREVALKRYLNCYLDDDSKDIYTHCMLHTFFKLHSRGNIYMCVQGTHHRNSFNLYEHD